MKRPHPTPTAPRGRRPEDRAQRRERYLDAALEVIGEQGPGASMSAIARAAGISKPILYRHFGDRDGLIAALADRLADRLVAELDQVFADAESPAQLLRSAIEAYVGIIEDDPGLYRYLTQRTPARGAALSSLVDRIAAAIEHVLRAGFDELGGDPTRSRSWAYGIVGMVHLAGDDWVTTRRVPRDRFVSELSELLWHGLTGAFPGADTAPATRTGPER